MTAKEQRQMFRGLYEAVITDYYLVITHKGVTEGLDIDTAYYK
jgi:hypothetical protein